MMAIVSRRSRSIDGLVVGDVDKPVPGPGELLVRVRTATVTRGDVLLHRMPRLAARLVGETPKHTPGHEFAGEIESVGGAVPDFDAGDRVFGSTSGLEQGSLAEYVVVPADGLVTTIPDGIGFAEAAPVPVGAMTALSFLRKGGVAAGTRVVVNGASGSVGSFAVQIAKHMGGHVTAVCSAANAGLVASLGADDVIDYHARDITDGADAFDVFFDAVGKLSPKRARPALSTEGRFVTTRARRRETVEDFVAVRRMLAEGVIEAVVDRSYALEEVAAAFRHVASGRKRGNVVVCIDRSAGDNGG